MRRADSGPSSRSYRSVRRERLAPRGVRGGVRLLAFVALDAVLATLLVVLVVPPAPRMILLESLCTALALAGVLPLIASAVQWGIVGFHYFRLPYRHLRPFYPRISVVVPAWN